MDVDCDAAGMFEIWEYYVGAERGIGNGYGERFWDGGGTLRNESGIGREVTGSRTE